MPVWKFVQPTGGTIELEDASLDLAAYYQALEDLGMWLRAHDGLEFEDLQTLLEAAAYDLTDLGLSLEAFSAYLEDLGLDLHTWATDILDVLFDLRTYGEPVEDLVTGLHAGAYGYADLAMLLEAASSTVLLDLVMALSVTDGIITENFGLSLHAMVAAPAFKAITAQRLTSIMTEIT
jgi:hypothetical protein